VNKASPSTWQMPSTERARVKARFSTAAAWLRFGWQSVPTQPTSVGRHAREPLAFRRG
jgi:hypothetical protein